MVLTGPVIRRRLALLLAIFFVLFAALGGRLFQLQILKAEELQLRAQSQWTSESTIQPTRGRILDRNGAVLAQSATAYTLSVSPRQVKNAAALAQVLAPILDMDASTIEQKASDTSKGGVTLKRQLSRDVAQEIKSLMAQEAQASEPLLTGLYLEEESKRYYPMGELACQVLGLTTIDGVGQAGLEQLLDSYLSGKAGRVLEEIDGKGRELDYSASEYIAAVEGGSVTLTLDASIQSFAEKAAREALSVNNAKAVRVLVMDPQTGEILAMVNKPDYDLNDPPRDDVDTLTELMRNRCITDAYEPGSTFKILTASAALDSGLVTPNEGFYCSGSIYVEGGRIKCWGRPHGAETFAQALQNSCNPVFVEMGLRLGVERFYDYIEAFGLGSPTGVDLQGEAGGIVIPESACKRVDIARIGFGQSIAVTPLQLLTAACAAVNGGNLLEPYIVQEITDGSGTVIQRGQRQVVANPISTETSATMRDLLEQVVAVGGGKNAAIPGYRIGGKTGTAQVYVDGVVSSDKHIGSFLGFAPIDDPQIAVLLIVEEADVAIDFGSVTAAPYARDILEQALMYMGIAPSTGEKEAEQVRVPAVTGLNLADASAAVKAAGLDCVFDGEGGIVTNQLPAAGASMAKGSLMMLYVDNLTDLRNNSRVQVPDVTGLSVLEANRILRSYGLKMQIEGSGLAVSQVPAAGDEVFPTASVAVTFEPP